MQKRLCGTARCLVDMLGTSKPFGVVFNTCKLPSLHLVSVLFALPTLSALYTFGIFLFAPFFLVQQYAEEGYHSCKILSGPINRLVITAAITMYQGQRYG